MKLITRDTDYAVRALAYVAAARQDVVSVTELVKKLKIPRPFLRKILQTLNKKGILESAKGFGGGFRLAVKPGDVYLLKLMEIFQGKFRLNECLLKNKFCPNISRCPLRKKINNIERYVISELKGVTLASLNKRGG
ncbi:MAG: Rrf2 family transcriptional regulator [Candidatus Omnitrophota bacterium]